MLPLHTPLTSGWDKRSKQFSCESPVAYQMNRKVGHAHTMGRQPVDVRFFVYVHSLLNQLMDFDQTCKDTLLGGWEED